jgi:hypothetical protein
LARKFWRQNFATIRSSIMTHQTVSAGPISLILLSGIMSGW